MGGKMNETKEKEHSMRLDQRHAFGTITNENAAAVAQRLYELLHNHRFAVVEVRTADPTRPRIYMDSMLSIHLFPQDERLVFVSGDEILITTNRQRWPIRIGATCEFAASLDQARFVVEQFGVTYLFAVQDDNED
jgi:hypothetical protein